MLITFETLYDKMTLIREGKREEIPFEIRTGPSDRHVGTCLEPSHISPRKAPISKKLSSDRKAYSAHSAPRISKTPPLDSLMN